MSECSEAELAQIPATWQHLERLSALETRPVEAFVTLKTICPSAGGLLHLTESTSAKLPRILYHIRLWAHASVLLLRPPRSMAWS